jgi:uncharacterized alkaline shock family protein YloU
MTHVVSTADGAITVTDGALNQIVTQAAEAVDGARIRRRPLRKLDIQIDGSRARVDLPIAVAYGRVLPDVARDVQQHVRDALGRMCGVDVVAVDVAVEELDR